MNIDTSSADTPLAWRKSSYSNATGNCVEVAPVWRKSSYSTGTGNCVEVAPAWRKSSHSTATGSCVEVAPVAESVLIRHSKHPSTGTISFLPDAWAAFLREAPTASASANGVATITRDGTDTLVKSVATNVELRFNEGEWSAFISGATDGEFDFTSEPTR